MTTETLAGAARPPRRRPDRAGRRPAALWTSRATLAVTDFKLRFFGSVLGYLWQLMRPLLLFGVLYVVFTRVVRLGSGVEYYPVALLLGIVLYTFLERGDLVGAVSSLVDRESLVRKIEFPRLAVPMASVLTALFNLGLNLIVVFVFLVRGGRRRRAGRGSSCRSCSPRWRSFAAGLAMLLSSALRALPRHRSRSGTSCSRSSSTRRRSSTRSTS